jgi:NADH:ubiquinone oxidoreductase subunit D
MRDYLNHEKFEWSQLNPETLDALDRIIKKIPEEHRESNYALPWIVNHLKQMLDEEQKNNRTCSKQKIRKAILDGLRHCNIDHPGSIDANLYDSARKRIMANVGTALQNHNIRLT